MKEFKEALTKVLATIKVKGDLQAIFDKVINKDFGFKDSLNLIRLISDKGEELAKANGNRKTSYQGIGFHLDKPFIYIYFRRYKLSKGEAISQNLDLSTLD